jgi:uncharacterized protein (TIGR03067 family)
MRVRVIVALIALSGLTAFAPAPFPKSGRRGDPGVISLQNFQGNWRAVSFDSVGPNNQRSKIGLWFESVRVKGDTWIYVVGGKENLSYRLVIDGDKRPALIDYYEVQGKPERPGMVGIMRREGNRVTILYYATTPDARAKSFENVPVNWWLLVLERQ